VPEVIVLPGGDSMTSVPARQIAARVRIARNDRIDGSMATILIAIFLFSRRILPQMGTDDHRLEKIFPTNQHKEARMMETVVAFLFVPIRVNSWAIIPRCQNGKRKTREA
jgi:hypothetical protein